MTLAIALDVATRPNAPKDTRDTAQGIASEARARIAADDTARPV
jgi:hypothetical protein